MLSKHNLPKAKLTTRRQCVRLKQHGHSCARKTTSVISSTAETGSGGGTRTRLSPITVHFSPCAEPVFASSFPVWRRPPSWPRPGTSCSTWAASGARVSSSWSVCLGGVRVAYVGAAPSVASSSSLASSCVVPSASCSDVSASSTCAVSSFRSPWRSSSPGVCVVSPRDTCSWTGRRSLSSSRTRRSEDNAVDRSSESNLCCAVSGQ